MSAPMLRRHRRRMGVSDLLRISQRGRVVVSRRPPMGAHLAPDWRRPTLADGRRAAVVAAPAAALGALVAFLWDPRSGRRRRHTLRDRTVSRVRRAERRALTRARRSEYRAIGRVRGTLNARRDHEPPDDVALAHKVESALGRERAMPKGRISINAEDGVVFLRGAVDDSSTIAAAGQAAQRVRGVREVENLLHLPATPAPASRPKLIRNNAVH